MMTNHSISLKKPRSRHRKNLFWFIPRDQLNLYRNNNTDNIESNKTSHKGHEVGNKINALPSCTELSNNVALRWVSRSCISFGDASYEQSTIEEQYDYHEGQLLGLRFIDSQHIKQKLEGRKNNDK